MRSTHWPAHQPDISGRSPPARRVVKLLFLRLNLYRAGLVSDRENNARPGGAARDAAISRDAALLQHRAHETHFNSRQSGSGSFRHRHAQNAGWRELALCALAAAGRASRHGVHFAGPRRMDREIFRDGARSARPRLCGRGARLARSRPVRSRARRSAQELRAQLLRIRQRSRDFHARGRVAGLPAADFRHRSFHRRGRADPRRASRPSLVRPHGADLAAASARRRRLCAWLRSADRSRAAHRRLWHHVRAENRHQHRRIAAVSRQYSHHRSGALRPQCRDHRGGACAFGRRADGGLDGRGVPLDAGDARARLRGANPPADPDRRQRQRCGGVE